jgi:hypothetical protein
VAQLVGAIFLILVGMRCLFGVSARWPPARWSLVVRRTLGAAMLVYGTVLLGTAIADG